MILGPGKYRASSLPPMSTEPCGKQLGNVYLDSMGNKDAEESTMVECSLLRQISKEDHDAFSELHTRYRRRLHLIAFSILKDSREAEDVMQEVFTQIWRRAPQYCESAGKPFLWACAITRNRSIDRIRCRERQLRVLDDFADTVKWRERELGTHPPEMATQRGVDQINQALSELPFDQRRAIALSFYDCLTHLEVSQALQKPLGTVKSQIRRGLNLLRCLLERQRDVCPVSRNASRSATGARRGNHSRTRAYVGNPDLV